MIDLLLYGLGSVVIFLLWMVLQNKTQWFFLNPLVCSMISVISLLLFMDVPYERYMRGARFIDYLMEPAVVVLGYPLYKQLRMIGRQWQALLGVSLMSVIIVLSVSTLLARLLGLDDWVIKSLVTMNITTAISMETSEALGGEAALAASIVLIAGFTGCTLGLYLLKKLHLTEARSVGLAIGSVSHALGTAVIARDSYVSSAYSSTALILCAIFTALIAPLYIPFLLQF